MRAGRSTQFTPTLALDVPGWTIGVHALVTRMCSDGCTDAAVRKYNQRSGGQRKRGDACSKSMALPTLSCGACRAIPRNDSRLMEVTRTNEHADLTGVCCGEQRPKQAGALMDLPNLQMDGGQCGTFG